MPTPSVAPFLAEHSGRDALIRQLQADVVTLASEIGERNTACFANLERAASFIRASVQSEA